MILLLIGFSLGMLSCWLMNRVPRDRDPDWRRSFNQENTNRSSGPPTYGWGARQLPPPSPPPAGYKRLPLPPPDVMEAINRQLDRDIAAEVARRRGSNPPILTEGRIQRGNGNGNGGPSTEKPLIKP